MRIRNVPSKYYHTSEHTVNANSVLSVTTLCIFVISGILFAREQVQSRGKLRSPVTSSV